MLFVGAKKYGIKYSDWQENEGIIWNLLLRFSNELDAQGISNILNSLSKMKRHFFSVMESNVKASILNSVNHNRNNRNMDQD